MSTSTITWRPRLPSHLKRPVPQGDHFFQIKEELARTALPTVCEEALCPNRNECWSRGTLTFQILGSICTRRCSFCAETTGRPNAVVADEPEKLLEASLRLKLKHVVITSPARDDLQDQGAGQFAACIKILHEKAPGLTVEVLTPDFQGRPDLLKTVFDARPDIFNHNVETIRRLTPKVRARATYERSLEVLKAANDAGLTAKSGLMIGLGETTDELMETFSDMKAHGVKLLTVGQYLPPSADHFPVQKFYTPDEFAELNRLAKPLFEQAMIGPLVRSSYHADEMVTE
jgi:lipoic acid synthetase